MKLCYLIYLFTFLKLTYLHSETTLSWVDIPSTDYKIILNEDQNEINHLNDLVSDYHLIDKSSIDSQNARIQSLEAISMYLNTLAKLDKFENKKSTLILLKDHVEAKKCYIEKLLQIPSDEMIEQYHKDFSNQLSPHFDSLSMRNNHSYSVKTREYWGKFWLETIDPCHRRLANYYQFWLETKPLNTNTINFFFWLETQGIPTNIDHVNYYSEKMLDTCKVIFSNGYLIKYNTHELVNTLKGSRNICIMSLAQDLYIETVTPGVWHNSLSVGKPVLFAGLIEIKDGIIESVSLESGHYFPSFAAGFQFLKILLENNAQFTYSFDFTYFKNRNKYQVTLSTSFIKSYEDFEKMILDPSKRQLISSNEF